VTDDSPEAFVSQFQQDFRAEFRALAKAFVSGARGWFELLPGDRWSVVSVRQARLGYEVTQAIDKFMHGVLGALLTNLNKARDGAITAGVETVRQALKGARKPAPWPALERTIVVSGRIYRATDEELRRRVKAIVDQYVLPEAQKLVPEFGFSDTLGGVHGQFDPETGIVTLNPAIFFYANRKKAVFTVVHEWCHAWAFSKHGALQRGWIALSRWKKQEGAAPAGYGRYMEKRSGWTPGPSEWIYQKDTWFLRKYSTKSPHEDFADVAAAMMLGQLPDNIPLSGQQKRRYIDHLSKGAV